MKTKKELRTRIEYLENKLQTKPIDYEEFGAGMVEIALKNLQIQNGWYKKEIIT